MVAKRRISETSRDKRKKRKVKPLVLIVAEGKDTEIDYFKHFNQKYVNVDVKPLDRYSSGKNKSRKTDPLNLVEKAIEYVENKYDISEEDGDRIWCLMDIDLNYNNPNPIDSRIIEIQKAFSRSEEFRKKRKIRVNLGLSNPCFELWYLLHFNYTTANMRDYDSIKKRLERDTPLSEYEKNKSVYSQIHFNTLTAIKNSEKLRVHHNFCSPILEINHSTISDFVRSNPITNIDILVGYIEHLNNN